MNAMSRELITVQPAQQQTYFPCASPTRGARAREVPAQDIGVTFIHRWSDMVELSDKCVLEPIHERFREKNCEKWLAVKGIE